MNVDVVLYHANCWDGFCAAWLMRGECPGAEFIPAHYGTDPPNVAGKRVAILDFSYKRPVMLRILRQAKHVLVLDHHKTAEAALDGIVDQWMSVSGFQCPGPEDFPVIIFDMDKSGGRITWEFIERLHMHEGGTPPWLVDYTEDRDLWRWRLEASREINAALRSYPLDFELWDKFAASEPSEFVSEGMAILRREAQIVADHTRHGVPCHLDGFHGLKVNATTLFSDIAGELAEKSDFGLCYFDRSDGKRQFSIRSRGADGIDVSAIASARGGGGHKNAAGWEEAVSLP